MKKRVKVEYNHERKWNKMKCDLLSCNVGSWKNSDGEYVSFTLRNQETIRDDAENIDEMSG